ncbi:hypothetical protein PSSHI_04630 [Photobacterium sp. R1]
MNLPADGRFTLNNHDQRSSSEATDSQWHEKGRRDIAEIEEAELIWPVPQP